MLPQANQMLSDSAMKLEKAERAKLHSLEQQTQEEQSLISTVCDSIERCNILSAHVWGNHPFSYRAFRVEPASSEKKSQKTLQVLNT
jgi:hypothetical protein